MKKLLVTLTLLTFGLISAGTSYASYGSVACQPVYGGGENCQTVGNLLLNKTVLDPNTTGKGKTETYVDNLSINNSRYSAGQTIKFKLAITNTGNSTLSEVDVTDTLPSYVKFVSGPGSFDNNSHVLSFNLMNLNSNETRTYTIVGTIVNSLPTNQGVVCTVNQAEAKSGNSDSQDNSQFCIATSQTPGNTTKGGLPVMPAPSMNQTPATGPEMLPLLGMIPTALAGFALRRKSK